MNEDTHTSLTKFSSLANWGTIGHPNDMDRFWDFVIEAFENGDVTITSDQFHESVKENCHDEETLDRIFIKYESGIDLLKRYTETRSSS